MFESVSGIKIIGGCFQSSCLPLLFFSQNDTNEKSKTVPTTAFIYGHNGTGKSSIANALMEYKNGESRLFSKVELLDRNSSPIDKYKFNVDSFYIFNEKFINDNVRFTEDGKLNSIVLFGESVSLTSRINILESRKKRFNNKFTIFEKELETLSNCNEITSPYFYKNKIQKWLRSNWANNERIIRSLRKAADVNDEIIDRFINATLPNESLDSLKQAYQDKFTALKNTKEQTIIDTPVALLPVDDELDYGIEQLLAMEINRPEFNNREQAILKMLETQENTNRINEIKKTFLNTETTECPYCFQEVNENYKNDLLQSISAVFDSQGAKQHRITLDKLDPPSFCIELEKYHIVDEELVRKIDASLKDYHELRQSTLGKIEQKKNNIYTPITNFQSCLLPKIKQINNLLGQLEDQRKEFNKSIDNISGLKESLQNINKKIAIIELQEDVKAYLDCNKKFIGKNEEIKKLKDILEKINKRINQLESKKNNINLAISLINGYLSYIFFASDRLQIELENNKYAVKVRGNSVSLKNLSEGEKNAIALCYFFSTILANKESKDFFKDECFVVLDDPISSFDFSNKVGIYTFLRYMLNHIHSGNTNSRVLILTHQIESMFHLQKVCGDISEYESNTTKIYPNYFILDNYKLSYFSKSINNKYNEYQLLINKIFAYANDTEESNLYDDSIGNSMRRVIESFGFFNYRKKMEAFFRDNEILALIQDDKKQEYFKNLMGRLILNNESHYQDQTRLGMECNFSKFITTEEKRNTARAILILLKTLNPLHLKNHLEDANSNLDIIEEWENQIFHTHLS